MRRAARRPAADAGERRDRSARRRRFRLSATPPISSGSRTRRTSRCSSSTPTSCGRRRPATGCSSSAILLAILAVALVPLAVCTGGRRCSVASLRAAGGRERLSRLVGRVSSAIASFSCRPPTAAARARSRRCRPRRSSRSRRRCARADGAPLGDVFSFVSGLYFRGKLAYARRFAQPPDPANPIVGGGVHVITPNAGLRSPDTLRDRTRAVRAFARGDVDADNAATAGRSRRARVRCCAEIGPRVRRRAARQRRVAEVRRPCSAASSASGCCSRSLRRPRRHEPRRAAAASRARRRRARLRAGRRRRPPRRAAAEAAAAPTARPKPRRERAATSPVRRRSLRTARSRARSADHPARPGQRRR